MIFVDTGAWYALATPSDPDHDRAKAFLAVNAEPLVTSDYVVDELLTLFAVRGRKAQGVEWKNDVLDCGGARLVRVSDDDFLQSLEVYEQFHDKAWSFTDCTSFVFIRRMRLSKAFSFDRHFSQFGIVTVVPEMD